MKRAEIVRRRLIYVIVQPVAVKHISVPCQYFYSSAEMAASKSCVSAKSQSSMHRPICSEETPRTVFAIQVPVNEYLNT